MRIEIAIQGSILWSGELPQLVVDNLKWVASVVAMSSGGLRINLKCSSSEAWIVDDKLHLGQLRGGQPQRLW